MKCNHPKVRPVNYLDNEGMTRHGAVCLICWESLEEKMITIELVRNYNNECYKCGRIVHYTQLFNDLCNDCGKIYE